MLAINSVISSSIIDDREDLESSIVVNHYLNIARLIMNKIYLPADNSIYENLVVATEKLPQSVRFQFKNAIARKRVKMSELQTECLSELKLDEDSLSKLQTDFIDLLVVGESLGIELGLKPGSLGSQIGQTEVVLGELLEQCKLITGTQLFGEFRKDTNRDFIWKKIFTRDVEHADFISIVDRYFFNPRNFSRDDNAVRWFLTKIQECVRNCKSVQIFCEENDDLKSDLFKKQLEFVAKKLKIELILVPELIWKQSQHHRYIRYGSLGTLIIDPGFDVFSKLVPKKCIYTKQIGANETRDRQDWEKRISQNFSKVLIGSM